MSDTTITTPTPSPAPEDSLVPPVEPLFDLQAAALFIPMRYDALRKYLSRHKREHPAIYRRQGSGHRLVRVLSAREIRAIRARTLLGAVEEAA